MRGFEYRRILHAHADQVGNIEESPVVDSFRRDFPKRNTIRLFLEQSRRARRRFRCSRSTIMLGRGLEPSIAAWTNDQSRCFDYVLLAIAASPALPIRSRPRRQAIERFQQEAEVVVSRSSGSLSGFRIRVIADRRNRQPMRIVIAERTPCSS